LICGKEEALSRISSIISCDRLKKTIRMESNSAIVSTDTAHAAIHYIRGKY
jgi:hypothetical protein